jgi:PKD repeat protein
VIVLIGSAYALYTQGYFGGGADKVKTPPPPTVNRPPIAVFEMLNGSNGRVGEELHFDANASDDPDGELTQLEWYWGDGSKDIVTNVTRRNITHIYYGPGEFQINLTVVDNEFGRDTIIKLITIRPTDYQASGLEILLSREPGGVSLPSNFSTMIPVEEYAVSLEINISFLGAAVDDNSLVDSIIEVTISDPTLIVIANETKESRFQNQNINFFFDKNDLANKGNYRLDAECLQGSLQLSYDIEVLY